jgi:hypothetical protein
MRPTLLNSCARAATAAEARFRISYPGFTPRDSRVIALDAGAATIVHGLAGRRWDGGHFLVFESAVPDDALLSRDDGSTSLLGEELNNADAVIMVGTAATTAGAAAAVGDFCAARGIMTAGLVLPESADGNDRPDAAVAALRPNAMVLVILRDVADVAEVLAALRV